MYKKIGAECHVNLHHRRMIIIKSIAPKGAYCRIMALKLILRAALRYFSDSERSELDKCDIPRKKSKFNATASCPETTPEHLRSSESPRHSNSSIFFVIILVTSCRSSLSLSRLDPAFAARVSWYSLAVLDMNVSVRVPVNQSPYTVRCGD